MDSENESLPDYHENYEETEIDIFIYKETDYIMDIYYDLKDRIPYFLDKLQFSDLLHFIIDIKFNRYKNNKRYNQRHLEYFEQEYKQEIDGILYAMNNSLLIYKKLQIGYNEFLLFSYNFTTVI